MLGFGESYNRDLMVIHFPCTLESHSNAEKGKTKNSFINFSITDIYGLQKYVLSLSHIHTDKVT